MTWDAVTLTEAIIQLWLAAHLFPGSSHPRHWQPWASQKWDRWSLCDTQDMMSSPPAYTPVVLHLGDNTHGMWATGWSSTLSVPSELDCCWAMEGSLAPDCSDNPHMTSSCGYP